MGAVSTVPLTNSVPLATTSATDLVDLAWELTCSAGIVVKIDLVNTDRGLERCVSARCIAGQHAFMLVPRADEHTVEVWWAEYDADLELVGNADDVEAILALARNTCSARKSEGPISLDTVRAAKTARRSWRRSA